MDVFPSPCQSQKRIFLAFYKKKLGRFLKSRTCESMGGPPKTDPKEFLTLMLAHTQPPVIHQHYHLSTLTSLWLQRLPPQVNIAQLGLSGFSVSPDFGVEVCLQLQFLIGPINVIDFQSVHFFLVLMADGTSSKLNMSELKAAVLYSYSSF